LAYVSDGYPTLSQTFTLREVRGLFADGIPVEVFSLHAPRALDPRADPRRDPPITVLPAPWAPAVLVAALRELLRHPLRLGELALRALLPHTTPWRWPLQARAPVHLLWGAWLAGRLPQDAHVHAQFVGAASNVAWMAARLRGTTFSFTTHSDWGLPMLRAKLRGAAFAVAISDHQKRRLLALCPDVPPERVLVSPLGIEMGDWVHADAPLGEPLRVVSTGNLGATKGHDTLVEAVARLSGEGVPVHLDVVGSGPERARLEGLIDRFGAGGAVTLHGAQPHEEVRRLTLRAHVVALACRQTAGGDVDGLPIVLMEGMAAGKAVVSCPVGAIPELIEDGVSGLLVPPDRADLLAQALLRLARDPDLRSRLGAAAQARVAARHDADAARRRMAQLMGAWLSGIGAAPLLEARGRA
jgi:glycosyltransferase involved in cell wall biosynthesis